MGLFLSSGRFWFLPVLCSERESRSSSRRLRSGSRSARKGSRDRNGSKAWRLCRLASLVFRSAPCSSQGQALTPEPRTAERGSRPAPQSAPLIEEVRFAADSALEGDGFELLVPRHKSRGFPQHSGHCGGSGALKRYHLIVQPFFFCASNSGGTGIAHPLRPNVWANDDHVGNAPRRFARKVQVMELPPVETGLTLSTLNVVEARSRAIFTPLAQFLRFLPAASPAAATDPRLPPGRRV